MSKPFTDRQKTLYKNKVFKVLTEQNFIINEEEKRIIEQKTSSGRRYFFIVLKRNENGKIVERFLKIPQNNSKKLLEPFKRQILFAEYVKNHTDLQTRGVIDSNYEPKKEFLLPLWKLFPKIIQRLVLLKAITGQNYLAT